jgi:hypothetical protein
MRAQCRTFPPWERSDVPLRVTLYHMIYGDIPGTCPAVGTENFWNVLDGGFNMPMALAMGMGSQRLPWASNAKKRGEI